MLLRSTLRSSTCSSWSPRQIVRMVSIRHELEKVFFQKGTTAEIQKRLDDLISGRRNRKTFRIADLGNILKYTVKLNLKLDYEFVSAEIKKCSELMTAKLVSKSFLAMSSIGKPREGQATKGNSSEFLLLVAALGPKVRSCREKWGAYDMSTILNGLQHMRSQYKEVAQLVSELPPQLEKCHQVLDAQQLGTALYGLQNLNSAHSESIQQRVSGQALAKALYGLQNMHSEHQEVLQLVVALTPHVTSCIDNFTPQDVHMAMCGLKNLSSSRKEVVLLLDVLLPRVRSCQLPLSPEQISGALHGLQNMSSKRKEVLSLLELLTPHSFQQPCSPQSLCMALYGLSNLDYLECKALVDRLVAMLLDISTAGGMAHWETRDLSMAVLATNALLQDVETLRRSLSSALNKRERPKIVCESEIDVIRTAQKLFSVGRLNVDPILRTMKVQVLSNTWLHGFEAYLVLRISGAYSGSAMSACGGKQFKCIGGKSNCSIDLV
eukprot:gene32864-42543_t